MVSPIWKAAAEGDVPKLQELLKDASPVDIEIKDHTGVTPLIQAVKNGHADAVRVLLAYRADPSNASSQGKPESYTQDPIIIDMLRSHSNGVNGFVHPAHTGPGLHEHPEGHQYDQNAAQPAPYPGPGMPYYYMPPGAPYPPYGYMAPPPGPDGMPMSGYYHPPMPPQGPQGPQQGAEQQQQQQQDGGRQDLAQQGHSPGIHIPVEVARSIPCRYYPMCKFGASCMFMHPPAPGQYYNGPPPPGPYAPGQYDNVGHPSSFPPQGYYGVPPPQPYPPQPSVTPTNVAPQSPVQHTTNHPPSAHSAPYPPEAPTSAPAQMPPPVPYGYPPNTQPPMQPNGITISTTGPYPVIMPVQNAYPTPVSPTHHRKESAASYQQPLLPGQPPQSNGFADGKPQYSPEEPRTGPPSTFHRDGYRKPGFRRTSLNGQPRQPCLFFPAGKCKNGNECRFPHVRPEDDPEAFGPEGYPPPTFPQRNGPRPFRSLNAQRSFGPREDGPNGVDATPNGRPMVNGFRKPFGMEQNGHFASGPRGGFNGSGFRNADKFARPGPRQPTPPKEKVLTAADFPSLNGTVTPSGSAYNPANGLTAAQVLKRNAPPNTTNGHHDGTNGLTDAMAKVTINGDTNKTNGSSVSRAESPELPAPVFPSINDSLPTKLVAAA